MRVELGHSVFNSANKHRFFIRLDGFLFPDYHFAFVKLHWSDGPNCNSY